MPISPRIGLRTLRATDLLPSFPLSPLWQTHPEREPHSLYSAPHSPPGFPIPQLLAPLPTPSSCTHVGKQLYTEKTSLRVSSSSSQTDKPVSGTSSLHLSSLPTLYRNLYPDSPLCLSTMDSSRLCPAGRRTRWTLGSPLLSTQFRQGKDGESLPHLCSIICSVSSHSHGSHSGCLGPHTPSCDSFSSSPAYRMQSLMPLPSREKERGRGDRERQEKDAVSPMTSGSCHTARTSSTLDNGQPRPFSSDWE